MMPDLGDVRRLRKGLGLTQARLASIAGVSQSAIAKIERGQMVPSYEMAKKIFDALQKKLSEVEPEAIASRVRTKVVRTTSPDSTLQEAAEVMRHHGFSQLPVTKDGKIVGNVTEGAIATLILEGRDLKDLARIKVSQIMDAPLPTIDEDAPVSIVAALLQRYPAVIVVKRGEIAGIVAKSDLMKLL